MIDPRPDLVDDSMTWDAVIAGASADVPLLALLALLKALRCEGAVLFFNEMGRLRLDWRQAARRMVEGENEILRRLGMVKDRMAALFARVEVGE